GRVYQEDFAVADPAGAGRPDDAVGDGVGPLVADPDGDLHLRQEGQAVLAAGVAVEVTLLPGVALRLLDDARRHVQLGDGPQDRLGRDGFDDNGELFHRICPAGPAPSPRRPLPIGYTGSGQRPGGRPRGRCPVTADTPAARARAALLLLLAC